MTMVYCAECGEEGGASLKTCKPYMLVKYCNADCQRNHWPKHKKQCKLANYALFNDPPAKEDFAICFLPMPKNLTCCIKLSPPTISSVPIFDFAIANVELADKATENIIHAAESPFVAGVSTPSVNLETMINLHFAIPTDVAKQLKRVLNS